MNIRKEFDQYLTFTLAFVCSVSLTAALYGQTPAVQPPKRPNLLMQEPLGDTTEPTMSLFILNVAPGATIPMHSHKGVVFAYLLEGDIENQLDPEPPKIFHAGDFFHERAMQVHRELRNLSQTEPAKLLVFQNTGSLPPTIKPLLQERLPNLTNQQVTVLRLAPAPGMKAPGHGHKHPGPVFAYIAKGDIENQVEPDPAKIYHPGDVFYEPPMHVHRMFQNLSKTEPTEVIVFEVTDKGARLAMPVDQ